jgi:hypothetical protein
MLSESTTAETSSEKGISPYQSCETQANSVGSSSSLPERTDDQGRSTSMLPRSSARVELTYSRPPRDGRGPGGPPRRGVRLHVVGIPDRTSWQVGSFPTLFFLVLAIGSSFHSFCGRVISLLLCLVVQLRFTLSCPGWSIASGLQAWRLLVESGWQKVDRRAPRESPFGWNDVSLLGASLGWSPSSLSIIFSLNLPYGFSLLWSSVVSVQS